MQHPSAHVCAANKPAAGQTRVVAAVECLIARCGCSCDWSDASQADRGEQQAANREQGAGASLADPGGAPVVTELGDLVE